MVYDRRKYEYFFPKKVYRCACLGQIITSCLHHGVYALSDIIDEIKHPECNETKKIFCINVVNIMKMLFLVVLII